MPNLLVLTANSKTNPLLLLAEVQEIRSALGEYSNFSVQHVNEVQSRDFVDVLLKHRPDILHFAGHGGSEQRIMLRSDEGEAPLSSHDLGVILQRLPQAPQLLVLNACFTADFSKALVPHVLAVVGAEGSIGDDAARLFARTFYSVLSESQPVGAAFDLAKITVNLAGYDGAKIDLKFPPSSDPEKLIFYARPDLMASFRLDEKRTL
jgi:hypothetical protein